MTKNDPHPNLTETYETIKLGIDAHAKWFYVARQLDGATPQPVQKMTFDGLLSFVAKQQRLAGKDARKLLFHPRGEYPRRSYSERGKGGCGGKGGY